MPVARGCQLPDGCLYDADNHIWLNALVDGKVQRGMATKATVMIGRVVANGIDRCP